MDTKEMSREQISAFADGELADQYVDVTMAAVKQADGRSDWEIYHQIGDVLRSDDMAISISPGFAARMAARLELEPTIVGPRVVAPASNPARRWVVPGMIAAAVASVAFVVTPQLMVAMKSDSSNSQSMVAAVEQTQAQSVKVSGGGIAGEQVAAVTANVPEGVVLRDPRIDDYLLAHQRFSPSMYSSAQFARSATFETTPGK